MSKEYAEKRNKKVKTVQPTTVEKIDETKAAKQDYAQTVAEKKDLAPKATENTTTDSVAKSADSSIKATSITAPKTNKTVKASTSIPTVKATNYDKSALVNEARNYNAQKRFIEKGYASEWEPKAQEIPTLKPELTDAQVISQYEEIPEYNVFQRMFNKDNREAYNRKQELSSRYNDIKKKSDYETLLSYGITEDDLRKAQEYLQGAHGGVFNKEYMNNRKALQKEMSDIYAKFDKVKAETGVNPYEMQFDYQTLLDIENARKHPVLTSIDARVATPAESIVNLGGHTADYLRGKPLTKKYSFAENVNNTVPENMSDLGKTIYGGVTSYGDMLMAMALAGGNPDLSSALLGIEKATSTANNAIEGGLTPRQIMSEALLSGATTYATEKMLGLTKIDELAKAPLGDIEGKLKLALEVAKRIGLSFIGEGSQEFLEGVADRIVDDWIAKDKSSVNREITRMVNDGVPEEEARKTANKEWLIQTAIEGVIGGVGGSLFGGTDIAINNIPFLNQSRINGDTNAEIPAVDQTENVAEEVQNNVPTVEEIAEEISSNPEIKNSDVNNSNDAYVKPNNYWNIGNDTFVGKATKIQAPYTGNDVLPQQTMQNTERLELPKEYLDDARTNINNASIDTKLHGTGISKILEKVYETLFTYRNTTQFDVPVTNLLANGKPYTVTVNKNAIAKIAQPNEYTIAVLDGIEDVIKNSNYVGSGDYIPNNIDINEKYSTPKNTEKPKDISRYDYFETPISINGKNYIVTYSVAVQPNMNRYRTHAVIDELKIQPINTADTGYVTPAAVNEVGFLNQGNIPSDLTIPHVEQNVNDVASVMNDYINSQQGNNVDTIPYPNDSRYVSEDVTAENLRNGENLNDVRERGYNETLIEKTDAPEELKAEVANNPMLYRVLHNPDVLAQVNEIVSNNSLDDAYKICNEMIGTKNPVALPLAYNLSKQFVQKGDVNTAVTLTEDAGRALTEAGQFIQATTISMLNNDPMASMAYLQRAIGRMNQEGAKKFKRKWKDFELTESEVEAFGNIEQGDVDAINDLYAQIWTRIGKTYPVKWWDKMLEMRRVFLLCNMRTTVRNGVSNTAMLPLRWTGGRVTALLESIYQRVNSEYVRTEAKGRISKEAKRVANEACDAYFKVLFDETDAKYTEARSAIQNAQVFKGGKLDATIDKGATWIANHGINATKSMLTAIDKTTGGAVSKFMDISGIKNINSLMNVINNKTAHHDINPSLLETIRNFTYWTLGEFGDTPFVKINFKQKLASYCEANGITRVEDIPQDAIALCVQEANKATFHDNSKVAQAMESLRETFNKFVPGAKLGDLIVTFAKAPGNIAARAVDYSPIGATKGAIDTVKGTANIKNLNKQIAQAQETVNTSESKAEIKKAQDAIAKYNNEKAQTMYQIQQALTLMGQGLTGTALFALGKALSRMGFVIGSLSDDKREKQYQQDVLGKQNNSVEIGDLSYSIDFLQPAALPILFGVIYEESFNQQSENFLTSLKQALVSVGDAWLDSTPMKNVSDMLGGYGTPTENIIDTILQIPSSWVPSQVNAITQIGDRTERISYDKSSVGNTIKNSVIAKLPGASETLPAKYDLWGREKVRQDTAGQAAFAKLVNPGTTKSTHPTEIDKDILSLYDKTKNVKVLPRFAENSYKVGDENYQLTNQQKSDFQRVMGENSYKLAEKYVKSDSWKNSNDTAKALALDSMYEFASNLAKREVLGATPSSAEKLLELYDKEGIDAVFNKLADDAQYKGYADELGVDSSKAKEIYENVGEEGMQKYARAVNEAQKFGADSIKTDEWNAFNSGNLGEFNNMVRTRVALENSNVPSTEATQKYIEQHGSNAIPQLEEAYNIVSTIPKGKDEYGNQQYFNLTSDMLDIYDKDGAKGLQNYKDALSIAQTKYGADNITTSEYKDYNNGFMDDFNDSVKYRTLLENNDLKNTELNRNYVKEYGESIIPVLQDAEEAITQIQKGVDKYNDAEYFSPNKNMIDVYMDKGKNGVELYADLYTRDDIDDDPNTRHLTDTIPYLYSMDMSDAEKGYYLSKFVSGKKVNSYIDRDQPDYAGLYNYYIHNNKYVPAIRAYANH